jgi:hypothetical protein
MLLSEIRKPMGPFVSSSRVCVNISHAFWFASTIAPVFVSKMNKASGNSSKIFRDFSLRNPLLSRTVWAVGVFP